MRLYLSSYRFGARPEWLVEFAGAGARVLNVVNAADDNPEDERGLKLADERARLEGLGFAVCELDLREYFGGARVGELERMVAGCDLVWVRGGNTFLLRRAMRASGFDAVLRRAVRSDAVAYGGYSAGIVILAPSLRGLEFVDEAFAVPAGYEADTPWDGLGLLEFMPVPHFESEHPEAGLVIRTVAWLEENGVAWQPVRDGEVLVVEGGSVRLLQA